MSFLIADVVNGRNLREGAPVVAFIVNSQRDRYPLDANPNNFGSRSSHFFAIESLPIFATAADCGAIEVSNESQLSVRLALSLTGTSTWAELSKNAFSSRGGVRFLGRPVPEDGKDQANRRVYGLCIMHRDTYNHLVNKSRSPLAASCARDGYVGEYRSIADKGPDIESVLGLLTNFMHSPENIWRRPGGAVGAATDEFIVATNLWRLCSLCADAYIRQEMLPNTEVPPLLHALDSSDGLLFGADLREQLSQCSFLGHALLKGDYSSAQDVPDLSEFLSLLWDCAHLRTRMYEVHAHFYPSFYAGQDDNFPSILELARATLEDVWAEFTASELEDSTEHRVAQLEAELARTEATVSAMRVQLALARELAVRG